MLCNNCDVVVLTTAEITDIAASVYGAAVGLVSLTTHCVHHVTVSSTGCVPSYWDDRSVTIVACYDIGRDARSWKRQSSGLRSNSLTLSQGISVSQLFATITFSHLLSGITVSHHFISNSASHMYPGIPVCHLWTGFHISYLSAGISISDNCISNSISHLYQVQYLYLSPMSLNCVKISLCLTCVQISLPHTFA